MDWYVKYLSGLRKTASIMYFTDRYDAAMQLALRLKKI